MLSGFKLLQPQREQPRLLFRLLQIGQIVIAGFIAGFHVVAALFETQQQFRARRSIFCRAEFRAVVGRAELQPRFGVVTHAADFLAHERLKNGIYKVEQSLAAAEIFREMNGLAVFAAPVLGVIAEDFRVGQPETIDALLHVADEETVACGFASLAACSRRR